MIFHVVTHITLQLVGLLGTNDLGGVPGIAANALHPVQVILVEHVAENLIGLAGTDGVLLIRMASPLVQVGAVDDVAQHVLAPLGDLVSDDVGWDVGLGLAMMVVFMVESL